MLAALLLPVLAQASLADLDAYAIEPPTTLEQDRLTVCLDQASGDPANAILTANGWLVEAIGAERSFPLQCLGIAYTRLLRWAAAEETFLSARANALETGHRQRAKLAAMAGNSALAEGRAEAALADFDLAAADALLGADLTLGGEIAVDRSRALVALGRLEEADTALAIARRDASQNSDAWLLSATLARRQGKLDTANSLIVTAALLEPKSAAIGLEAGVIAALAGDDEAAKKSWNSVLAITPDAPEAATARNYLAQLATPAPEAQAE